MVTQDLQGALWGTPGLPLGHPRVKSKFRRVEKLLPIKGITYASVKLHSGSSPNLWVSGGLGGSMVITPKVFVTVIKVGGGKKT